MAHIRFLRNEGSMWKVVPYRSVGPVEFGMAPEEVSAALGARPDAVYGEGYVERYGQIFVRYDRWRRCCVVNVRTRPSCSRMIQAWKSLLANGSKRK